MTTSSRSPTRYEKSIARSTTAGLIVHVDDPVSRTCTTRSRRRAPRLSRMGAAARGRPQSRAARHSGRARALSRLFRELARSAHLRRAARRDHRVHPAGERGRVLDRGGQSAARARVASLGEDRSARRQNSRFRESSRITRSRSSTRESSPTGSSASRRSWGARTSSPERIAVSPRSIRSGACIPGHVGEVRSARRGRTARDARALGARRRLTHYSYSAWDFGAISSPSASKIRAAWPRTTKRTNHDHRLPRSLHHRAEAARSVP